MGALVKKYRKKKITVFRRKKTKNINMPSMVVELPPSPELARAVADSTVADTKRKLSSGRDVNGRSKPLRPSTLRNRKRKGQGTTPFVATGELVSTLKTVSKGDSASVETAKAPFVIRRLERLKRPALGLLPEVVDAVLEEFMKGAIK